MTDEPSANLLLWQSDPLTFYYCDRWTRWHFTTATLRHPFDTSRLLTSTPPKVGPFVTVIGPPPFFYPDCDRKSTFSLKRNVDVLSQVTGDHLEAFWLVSRRVDKMSQWSKSPWGKLLKVTVASKRAVGSEKYWKTPPLNTPCQISASWVSVWRPKS